MTARFESSCGYPAITGSASSVVSAIPSSVCVTRTTSSMVVFPCATPRQPSCCKVSMPSEIGHCEQKQLDDHVERAGDAADGIVRVQRAGSEVTPHGRSDRDVRRVDIANFAAARTSVSVTRASDRFSLHWQEQRQGGPRFDVRPATLSPALLQSS
jgi:hypothetical protein